MSTNKHSDFTTFASIIELLDEMENGNHISYELSKDWKFADGIDFESYKGNLKINWDEDEDELSGKEIREDNDYVFDEENDYDEDTDIGVLQEMYSWIVSPVVTTLWLLHPEKYMFYIKKNGNILRINTGLNELQQIMKHDDGGNPPFFPDMKGLTKSIFPFINTYKGLSRQIKRIQISENIFKEIYNIYFRNLLNVVKTPPKYKIKNYKLYEKNQLIWYSFGLMIFYNMLKIKVNTKWLDNTIKQLQKYTRKKIRRDKTLTELIWRFEMYYEGIMEEKEIDFNGILEIKQIEDIDDHMRSILDNALMKIEEEQENELEDDLIRKNSDDIIAVYSIIICGMENVTLVNLQLTDRDMNIIHHSYMTLGIEWKDTPEIFDIVDENWVEIVEKADAYEMENAVELVTELIDEFIEETISEFNLKNIKILTSKKIHVDYEEAGQTQSSPLSRKWRLKFGKILHENIVGVLGKYQIDVVDISIEDFVSEVDDADQFK